MSVAFTKNRLAEILRMQGDYQESARLIREAIVTYDTVYGATSHRARGARRELGRCLWRIGELDAAEELLRQWIDYFTEVANPNEQQVWLAYNRGELGQLLFERKDYEGAESQFLQALTIEGITDISKEGISVAERQIKSQETAAWDMELPSKMSVEDSMKIVSVANKVKRLRNVVVHLVDLYEAWDKPEEAARWRAKLNPE